MLVVSSHWKARDLCKVLPLAVRPGAGCTS